MRRLRQVRKGMSGQRHHDPGGGTVNMKKKWYDYLWILSLAYLALGFFNIWPPGWDCSASLFR